jgi:formate-dependent nitrite reductase membrane component NrfD
MSVQPFDFMIKETPSREWSEGMGQLIAVAFFCGATAGGLYLTSLYFGNLWGMFIGWLFALAMGLFDMAHLEKKDRVWRMPTRAGSSWISRGLIFVTLFIGAAAIDMALRYWAPGVTGAVRFFDVVAGILGFGVAIYGGFVLSFVQGIKFWNSAMIPILFLVSGLAGGSAILLAVASLAGSAQFDTIATFAKFILAAYAVVVFLHLWISTYSSSTAKTSVNMIVKGSLAGMFWLAVVLVGIVVPLIIDFVAGSGSSALVIVSAIFVLLGSLMLRFIVLKAGRYSPLIPV